MRSPHSAYLVSLPRTPRGLKPDLPRQREAKPPAGCQDRRVTWVSSTRERLSRYPLILDAVVAAAVLALSLPPLVNARSCGCDPAPAWAFGLVVLRAVLLLARRYPPFSVGLAAGVTTAVSGVSSLPDPAVPFAGLVAVYSAALFASRRLALLSAALPAVGIGLALLLSSTDATAQDWSINYLVF